MTFTKKINTKRTKRHPLRKTHASPFLTKKSKSGNKSDKVGIEDFSSPVELTGKELTTMRGKAHHLKAVVLVGDNGVTPQVIQATHEALLIHELIKVKLRQPEDKKQMAEKLANGTKAVLVALRGHTVVLYRENLKPERS
jgi:RNA-binding protein